MTAPTAQVGGGSETRNSKFVWQDAFARSQVTGNEGLIGLIMSLRDNGDGKGFFVSNQTLADATGLSLWTVREKVASLCERGWITRTSKGSNQGGRARASTYLLSYPAPSQPGSTPMLTEEEGPQLGGKPTLREVSASQPGSTPMLTGDADSQPGDTPMLREANAAESGTEDALNVGSRRSQRWNTPTPVDQSPLDPPSLDEAKPSKPASAWDRAKRPMTSERSTSQITSRRPSD